MTKTETIHSIYSDQLSEVVDRIATNIMDATEKRKVKQIFTEDGFTYLDATGALYRIMVSVGDSLTMSNVVGIAGCTATYTNIPNAQIPAYLLESAPADREAMIRTYFGLIVWSSGQSKWLAASASYPLADLITNYGEELSGYHSEFMSRNTTSPETIEFEFGMDPAYWPCYIAKGETTTNSIGKFALMEDINGKANAADLPYAMVTPGEWEFSGSGVQDFVSYEVRYEAGESVSGVYYVFTLYGDDNLLDGVSVEDENPLSLTFENYHITATRASLPGHLLDRSVNAVPVSTNTTLTLPSIVTGKSRDFYLKMTVTGAQDVAFSPATGITYTGFGNPAKTYSDGTYLMHFTETSSNKFCISYMDVNLSLIDVRDTTDSLGRQDKRVAIGKNADASGLAPNGANNNYQSVAVGNNAKAKAPASVALGPWARTGGATPSSFGVAIGYRSYAPAQASVAIGSGVSSEKIEDAYTDEDGNSQEAYAIAEAKGAVQIGPGRNSETNSLKFRGTVLVDSSGKIPAASMEGTVVVSPEQYDGKRISIGTGSIVPDVVPSTDTHGNSMGGATVVGKSITSVVAIGNGSKVGRSFDVALGPGSKSYGGNSVAIGYNAEAYAQANNSVALGPNAILGYNAQNSVQLGGGTCSESCALQFRSTKLAQGTNATDIKILHDVLPDDIATKDDIPCALVAPGEWENELPEGTELVSGLSFAIGSGDTYYWQMYIADENGSQHRLTSQMWSDRSHENDLSVTVSGNVYSAVTATRTSLPGHLFDRANNIVTAPKTMQLTLPPPLPNKSRDFRVRLVITAPITLPDKITFVGATTNGMQESISFETENGTFPVLNTISTNILHFTETAPSIFYISNKAVAPAPAP